MGRNSRYCTQTVRFKLILYHGTSTEFLPQILEKGLLPRSITGLKSHWDGDVESKPEFVYLTTAYPVYFAIHAAAAAAAENSNPVVLKIRINKKELYPDEDFVDYCLCSTDRTKIPGSFNPSINLHDYQQLAPASLKYNGIVSVKSVNKKNIISHIELESTYKLLFIGGDSMPIPMNYKILGEFYRNCMKILFEQGLDAAVEFARNNFLTSTNFEV